MTAFPKYAALGGVALIHHGDGYYWRPAGAWGVTCEIQDGKLVISKVDDREMKPHLGKSLTETTEAVFVMDNQGYL